jgi:hypothetical protein
MRGVKKRKITKLVKEIRTHLKLQPPNSPIASEGEESLKIESFEERIARFDEETPVQQWYVMRALAASALTMVALLEHPHLTLLLLTPLIRQILEVLKKAKTKMTTMSEASRSPPQHFLVLNDKVGEISIKA